MYSRSAKGEEKGDPNRNPWLAKMSMDREMWKKTRGGIELCVSREISVLDDNLHGSRDDSFDYGPLLE